MKKGMIKKIFIGFTAFVFLTSAYQVAYAAAPLPPKDVRAEAGDSKATIYFTPDLSSFDVTATYIVSSVASGPAPVFTGTGAVSPIVVSGLSNGTSYKFVVKAKNSSGVSVNSAPSNSVIPVEKLEGDPPSGDNVNPPDSEGGDKNIQIRYVNPISSENIEDFIAKVIDSAVLLLTPIIVIMLIWTGFLFISARGNPESLASAKKALLYVLIGAVIILVAKGFSLALRGVFSQF